MLAYLFLESLKSLIGQRHFARMPRFKSPCSSAPYRLSPSSRLSAVDLAVPFKGIGAEKLRLESWREDFE